LPLHARSRSGTSVRTHALPLERPAPNRAKASGAGVAEGAEAFGFFGGAGVGGVELGGAAEGELGVQGVVGHQVELADDVVAEGEGRVVLEGAAGGLGQATEGLGVAGGAAD